MTEPAAATKVVVKLNQQQRALLDRTIAGGAAPDIAALVLRALRETQAGYAEGGVPRS